MMPSTLSSSLASWIFSSSCSLSTRRRSKLKPLKGKALVSHLCTFHVLCVYVFCVILSCKDEKDHLCGQWQGLAYFSTQVF